jgi:hypothetical protein
VGNPEFRTGLIIGGLAAALLVGCGGDGDTTIIKKASPITVTAPAPTTPAPPPVQDGLDCGDLAESGAGTYGVRALEADCGTARQVAQEWENGCVGAQLTNPCTVSAGFECSVDESGLELYRVSCKSGGATVRFENGS